MPDDGSRSGPVCRRSGLEPFPGGPLLGDISLPKPRELFSSIDQFGSNHRTTRPSFASTVMREFRIDVEACEHCGGAMRIIASIEEPALNARILAHRRERGAKGPPVASLGPRALPPGGLF